MDEKTIRIIKRMRTQLGEYKQGNYSLLALVNDLEGGLNAIEEELPGEFMNKWFVHWGGLEEILAVGIEEARENEIIGDVEASENEIIENIEALELLLSKLINPEN